MYRLEWLAMPVCLFMYLFIDCAILINTDLSWIFKINYFTHMHIKCRAKTLSIVFVLLDLVYKGSALFVI